MSQMMVTETGIAAVGDIRRDDIEDDKACLASQPGIHGRLSAETHWQRLRTMQQFFERIIEWDWHQARRLRRRGPGASAFPPAFTAPVGARRATP
jgi:hypothetical protein